MLPLEDLLTTSDAVCYSGLSAGTLRRYESQGLLAPLRSSRGIRLYRLKDLDLARQLYQARMVRTGPTGIRRPVAAGAPILGNNNNA